VESEITFEDVYRAHLPRVYRFCFSLMRDEDKAKDIASETFVSAFANFDKCPNDPDKTRVWLMTIAHNAAMDAFRKGKRWRGLYERLGRNAQDQAEDPMRSVELRADVRRVRDAIAEFRPKDRLLLALRLGSELSYADIAVITKMNERAVAMATRRALSNLRSTLGGLQ